MKPRVVVMTCDKYLPALRVFCWLFEKYWGDCYQVLVGGFTPPAWPLPLNFTFLPLGAMADYPAEKWSDALIKLLRGLDDEVFVLMLEDYWMQRPVDTRAVEIAADYARQFTNVLRFDLTLDRLFSFGPRYPGDVPDYGYAGHLDLVQTTDCQYQLSLMTAVWRRDNLLQLLRPGESPWQVELEGTNRAHARADLLVLGTRQGPVKHTLGLRGGDAGKWYIEGLRAEDLRALRALGYVPEGV